MKGRLFFLAFGAVTLLTAGAVSYLASASPDGLDSATQQGCDVVKTADGEELDGTCIAQSAVDHPLSESPLADYALGGNDTTTGLAGIMGVVVTLLVAGGAFWLIVRSRKNKTTAGG